MTRKSLNDVMIKVLWEGYERNKAFCENMLKLEKQLLEVDKTLKEVQAACRRSP